MGLIAQVISWCPRLYPKTTLMQSLTGDSVHFTWTPELEQEFLNAKHSVANQIRLTQWHMAHKDVLITDASRIGYGFTHIQLDNSKQVHIIQVK